MAQIVKLKRSNVTGSIPTTSSVDLGELAINTADGKVYLKRSDNTIQTIVTTNTSAPISGNINFSGSALVTGSIYVYSGSIYTPDSVQFNISSSVAALPGQFTWNDGDGTLDLGLKGGNVTLQLGQETLARVFNAENNTLVDGELVYISGSQGNRIAVKRASATNELGSANTLGMVTEQILSGNEGFVTILGVVHGLNTTGLTPGAPLWLSSSAGGYSQTKPNAPYHNVLVGFVQRVHASQGSIFVKIDNGYELDELHNVDFDNPQIGDLLVYVDGVNNLWQNKKQLTGSYQITGSLSVSGSILSNGVNVIDNAVAMAIALG